jgi:hypothetical protein
MDNPRIVETAFDGPEPIHRAAYLNDEMVASVYGNAHEDRWLIGWPLADETLWAKIFNLAMWHFSSRSNERPKFRAFVIFGRDSLKIEPIEYHPSWWQDMQRSMREHTRSRPNLIVLDGDDFQVEFTISENDDFALNAAMMTNSRSAGHHARLFSAFHANESVRGDRPWSRTLLDIVCKNNQMEDVKGGQVHHESRNGYLPAS